MADFPLASYLELLVLSPEEVSPEAHDHVLRELEAADLEGLDPDLLAWAEAYLSTQEVEDLVPLAKLSSLRQRLQAALPIVAAPPEFLAPGFLDAPRVAPPKLAPPESLDPPDPRAFAPPRISPWIPAGMLALALLFPQLESPFLASRSGERRASAGVGAKVFAPRSEAPSGPGASPSVASPPEADLAPEPEAAATFGSELFPAPRKIQRVSKATASAYQAPQALRFLASDHSPAPPARASYQAALLPGATVFEAKLEWDLAPASLVLEVDPELLGATHITLVDASEGMAPLPAGSASASAQLRYRVRTQPSKTKTLHLAAWIPTAGRHPTLPAGVLPRSSSPFTLTLAPGLTWGGSPPSGFRAQGETKLEGPLPRTPHLELGRIEAKAPAGCLAGLDLELCPQASLPEAKEPSPTWSRIEILVDRSASMRGHAAKIEAALASLQRRLQRTWPKVPLAVVDFDSGRRAPGSSKGFAGATDFSQLALAPGTWTLLLSDFLPTLGPTTAQAILEALGDPPESSAWTSVYVGSRTPPPLARVLSAAHRGPWIAESSLAQVDLERLARFDEGAGVGFRGGSSRSFQVRPRRTSPSGSEVRDALFAELRDRGELESLESRWAQNPDPARRELREAEIRSLLGRAPWLASTSAFFSPPPQGQAESLGTATPDRPEDLQSLRAWSPSLDSRPPLEVAQELLSLLDFEPEVQETRTFVKAGLSRVGAEDWARRVQAPEPFPKTEAASKALPPGTEPKTRVRFAPGSPLARKVYLGTPSKSPTPPGSFLEIATEDPLALFLPAPSASLRILLERTRPGQAPELWPLELPRSQSLKGEWIRLVLPD